MYLQFPSHGLFLWTCIMFFYYVHVFIVVCFLCVGPSQTVWSHGALSMSWRIILSIRTHFHRFYGELFILINYHPLHFHGIQLHSLCCTMDACYTGTLGVMMGFLRCGLWLLIRDGTVRPFRQQVAVCCCKGCNSERNQQCSSLCSFY